MYDINQIINSEGNTPELDLGDWSEQIAQELAGEEGITLSNEHWDVINFLRDHYQRCGPCPNGRAVLGLLEEHFSQQGGKKHLYHLLSIIRLKPPALAGQL